MTEQNGHEEHERNSARDGDAGFAALDATEPHFGSSALQGLAFEDSTFSAPVSFEPVVSLAPAISFEATGSFESTAPPVEVGGFEALNFEAPAPLAEPTLSWEVPPAVAPPSVEEPPYPDEPPYEDEPTYPAEPLYPETEYPETEYPEAEYAGEYWVPSDEATPADAIAEQCGGQETAPQKPNPKARQVEKPAHKKKPAPQKKSASAENAPKKWARNRAADLVAAEEFPDWHPAAHGFVEESIARDLGDDHPGYFPVPTAPLEPVPGGEAEQGAEESSEGSPRRSLLVDPNLPAVSIDEAPIRAFTPGGAEPRPMAAGRMSRAGAASIGSGLTAEEKEEIERQAAQRDKQKKRKSSRASKNTDYKRGFRRMSAAQQEKMRSRSPYAPAFGARNDDEETRKSPAGRGSGSNLFREGSSLNEELTPAEEALIRGIAEEEAQGVGIGKRRAASAGSPKGGSPTRGFQKGSASSQAEGAVTSWKQKVRAARAAEETDPYTRAKTIVYNQLAYSAKTRGQLRKKLQAEGFDAELIEPLLDKFEAAKLIDDAEYAQTFVAQKSRTKKLSRAALRRELAERGVHGEEAENALAQRTDEQEREDAAELVRKKLRPGMDLSDRAEKDRVTRRLLGMLARRGYSSSVSMSVIREELAAYGAEDELW
ncbi:RecX family transcriptional regulator [Rothia sp. HMSC066H02]|uniref:regulatory protein RecX n=1 Tax=Rothia TaxID=32207 RepID=UPI0008A5BBB1|nr:MULTISPECIES: regulatory protein RecX [Rothia]MBS4940757.1 RecX family transcriptional regulator [Rothia mucilaginosa]OFO96042.1 RecX family transcriptional regulator [Rothia sp. HMSC065D09]OFP13969.1 RecX family transcriptional regulator [Rothia sp. HMSC066H02]